MAQRLYEYSNKLKDDEDVYDEDIELQTAIAACVTRPFKAQPYVSVIASTSRGRSQHDVSEKTNKQQSITVSTDSAASNEKELDTTPPTTSAAAALSVTQQPPPNTDSSAWIALQQLASISSVQTLERLKPYLEKNQLLTNNEALFAERGKLPRLSSKRSKYESNRCPLCSRNYRSQAFLNEHMRKEHSVLI